MGVSVRHNAAVAAVVALLASVMTVAWFARALQTGSPVDWVLTLVLAAIGVLQLLVVRDGRAPLLVADEHGVRLRRGRTWSGLRWQDVAHVEVRSPGSWLRDGEIVVHPVTDDDRERFSVPLGMTTRVDHEGLTGDLVADLDLLASGEVPVLVLTGVPHAELGLVDAPGVEHGGYVSHEGQDDLADLDDLDGAQLQVGEPARELEDFGAPVRWRDRRRPWQAAPEQDDAGLDEHIEHAEHDDLDARDERDAPALEHDSDQDDQSHDAVRVEDREDADEDGAPRVRTRDRVGELRRLVALGVARAAQRRPSDRTEPTEDGVEDRSDETTDETRDGARVPTGVEALAHPETAISTDAAEHAGTTVASEAQDELESDDDEHEDDTDPADPVEPGRTTRPASRAEVVRESVRVLPTPPAIPEQRAGRDEDAPLPTAATLSAAERPVPVLVARLDDLGGQEPRGPEHPVIGPRINAARHRARLSIDTLGERTRIRPHVLERIEVDDFEACGGDFYARGHLRTLARIFGLDAEELVDLYDLHYASPEIEARQVFEAELASGIGGGVRAAHSGPRWSLLAASVLVLAGVWGVSRLADDTPQELVSPAPQVVDSAGLTSAQEKPTSSLAPLVVRASGADPEVVVRDRGGRILWAGKLADGRSQQVIGLAPFEVTSSNGGAVRVSYLGRDQGVVGQGAAAASKRFGSR